MAEKMNTSGCCNIMTSRAAKMGATNPPPPDKDRVMPDKGMMENRMHADDGRLTGMKKG